jgi:hypothetical protein
MLRSNFSEELTQFPEFAESETAPDRSFIASPTTVLSTTRFPKAVGSRRQMPSRPEFHLKRKTSPNSSPNCAPKRLQLVLFAPPYSFEICLSGLHDSSLNRPVEGSIPSASTNQIRHIAGRPRRFAHGPIFIPKLVRRGRDLFLMTS